MARGKVELRRIDDRARRLVSFSKRRSGLLKKARELAVLCDAEVGVIVFSPKGKLSHFSSHSSLEKTIQRYKRFLDLERSVSKNSLQLEEEHVGFADQATDHKVPKVDQRFHGDGSIEQLNVSELTKQEERLESMLRQTRSRKTALLMDLVTELREQERTLVSNNQQLHSVVGIDVVEGEEEEEPRGSEGNTGGASSSSSTGSASSSTSTGSASSSINAPQLPPPSRTLQLFLDT